ncbi:hypothetical protein E2C01_015916 [Portunus trituberculatus]|uniref:Uncharacterized protein n=1 Tax=Portunus trituberculatus TaxID=210409 RepID=A0A5B7DP88_PORTR|nr:hypothetical protein [Portunus trituberculatus]
MMASETGRSEVAAVLSVAENETQCYEAAFEENRALSYSLTRRLVLQDDYFVYFSLDTLVIVNKLLS